MNSYNGKLIEQGFKVSKFLFAMITYNISDLFRENTNNNNYCKNGKEAHNETIKAYGAMGFLKLDYEIKLKIAVGRNTIFIKKTKECTHTHTPTNLSTKIQKLKYLEEFDATNDKEEIIWGFWKTEQ